MRCIWTPFLSLLLLFGLATSSLAETNTVPLGCKPILTVQKRSCAVVNHYRCDGSNQIGFYYEDYDGDGSGMAISNTTDLAFISAIGIGSDFGIFAVPDKGREFSFRRLMQNGDETVRKFVTIHGGFIPQKDMNYNVDIILSGEVITIDGTVLQVGHSVVDIIIGPPFGSFHGEIDIYVSAQDGLVLEGRNTFQMGDDGVVDVADEAIVKLIRPGEVGFMSIVPEYDCGDHLSGLGLGIQEERG